MFRQRLSNVLGWLGFLLLVGIFVLLMVIYLLIWDVKVAHLALLLAALFGVAWVIIVVANYLLIGRLRILPWKDYE